MTDTSSSLAAPRSERSVLGWLLCIWLIPISLFPLVALLTYDWRAVASLRIPAEASTNWIGPLGDAFAYYGYQLFGLAV